MVDRYQIRRKKTDAANIRAPSWLSVKFKKDWRKVPCAESTDGKSQRIQKQTGKKKKNIVKEKQSLEGVFGEIDDGVETKDSLASESGKKSV